jgi:hypothetical protein
MPAITRGRETIPGEFLSDQLDSVNQNAEPPLPDSLAHDLGEFMTNQARQTGLPATIIRCPLLGAERGRHYGSNHAGGTSTRR